MAEKIELASFDFNVDAVVQSAQELADIIKRLKQDQKILKDGNLDTSEAYVKNQASLKTLNAEYNKHIKVLMADEQATADAIAREELMTIALNSEATSISEVRQQNKLLNKLRNETNVTTKEGQEQIKQLNSKLDQNNKLVKDNADQYLAQKLNIGNYKSALDGLSPRLGAMITQVQGIGRSLVVMKEGLIAQAGATKGSARALKIFRIALISTGIGAIVVALGSMVALFAQTREGTDKLTRVLTPLKEVFNSFLGVLERGGALLVEAFSKPQETVEKLGKMIKENIMNRVEGAISIFRRFINAGRDLVNLDFDSIGSNFDGLGEDISKTVTGVEDLGGKLKKFGSDTAEFFNEALTRGEKLAELSIQLEQDEIRLVQLRAENLRIIRQQELIAKDKLKTDAERKQALDTALKLTKEIELAELEVLNRKIEQKELQQEANDTDRNELLELAKLKAKRDENQDKTIKTELRFLGTKAELERSANARNKKAQDDAIKKQQEELDLFIQSQGEKARTLQEELDLERQISEQKLEILDAELEAKKISQEKYATEVLAIQQDLAGREAEIAVQSAEMELQRSQEALDRKREDAQFLTEALATLRQTENDQLLEEQRAFFELQLEQGVINQNEFDQAIREAKEENRIANKEIDDERELLEKEEAIELRAVEFEEELERLRGEKANKFEIEQAINDEQTSIALAKNKADLDNQLISQAQFEARKTKIEKSSEEARAKIKATLRQQELQATAGLLNAVGGVIDENSKAGKAIALAQAGINTYQGITAGISLGYPMAIPAVAFAALTGFKAISDIVKTKIPSATGKGNVGGGASAPQGLSGEIQGAVSGQGVNLTNIAGSGNSAVQGDVQQQANLDGLAENVGQAVEDGARAGTESGTETGLTNMSDNIDIREMSTA